MVLNVLLGLAVLLMYSYGIVMIASVVAQRSMLRDMLLIEKYRTLDEDSQMWEEDEETDEDGEVIARKFTLISNEEMEHKRLTKQKDNEDEDGSTD